MVCFSRHLTVVMCMCTVCVYVCALAHESVFVFVKCTGEFEEHEENTSALDTAALLRAGGSVPQGS